MRRIFAGVVTPALGAWVGRMHALEEWDVILDYVIAIETK